MILANRSWVYPLSPYCLDVGVRVCMCVWCGLFVFMCVHAWIWCTYVCEFVCVGCVGLCVLVCVCMRVYVCAYVSVYIHIYTNILIYIRTYIYTYLPICMYVQISVCTHKCTCTYKYIYIRIHTCTYTYVCLSGLLQATLTTQSYTRKQSRTRIIKYRPDCAKVYRPSASETCKIYADTRQKSHTWVIKHYLDCAKVHGPFDDLKIVWNAKRNRIHRVGKYPSMFVVFEHLRRVWKCNSNWWDVAGKWNVMGVMWKDIKCFRTLVPHTTARDSLRSYVCVYA